MTGTNPQDTPDRRGDEPTAVFPSYAQDERQRPYGSPYPLYGPSPAPPPAYTGGAGGFGSPTGPTSTPPKRRRGGGIVVAAVLAGALAGIGGSAGYIALAEPTQPTTTGSSAAPSSNVSDVQAPAGSVEAAAQAVLPSVVKIDVASPSGQTGSGSGIILTADGTIVTNNHVVEVAAEGGELAVSFNDGSSADAQIVGRDPVTDLAVIKAKGVSGLTPARLGSSDALDVGEQVVAVGSPFGLESTVTSGIVSSKNRPVTAGGGDQATVFPAIQTDAAINPGNSGGALVNMRGEVIGINTAIRGTVSATGQAGSIGLGFAIPIDEAKPIVEQLTDGEAATHARLGVRVVTPTNAEGLPGGASVESVDAGSSADEAGLREGDVVTKVNDQVITSSDGLVAMVRSYRPGDTVTLTIVRDGDTQELKATLDSDEGSNNT